MKQHIYFDLDGTLVDDTGQTLRPRIRSLLRRLTDEGHRLSLWTASTEERGQRILAQHGLGVRWWRRCSECGRSCGRSPSPSRR